MNYKKVEFTKEKDLKKGNLYLFADLKLTFVLEYQYTKNGLFYFKPLFTIERDTEPWGNSVLALPKYELQSLIPITMPKVTLSLLEEYEL